MVKVSESLVTKRYTGEEFEKASILDAGVTLEDLQAECERVIRKNRKKNQKKTRHRKKF
jgi:hypothetical protein